MLHRVRIVHWACLALLPLAPAIAANPPTQAAEERTIDALAFPLAVCNDGSQARYYVRKSTEPGYEKKWLIVFQGGGGCGSNDTCVERWLDFDGSSMPIGSHANMVGDGGQGMKEFDGKGILDGDGDDPATAESNPFRHFNRVHAHYCSSDSWKGRGGVQRMTGVYPDGTPLDMDIFFHGADIAEAVVRIVQQGKVDLGGAGDPVLSEVPDDASSEVVLYGQSAGAAGLASQLDDFAALLGAPGGDGGPRVWGIIDSNEAVGPGMDPRVKDKTALVAAAYWSGQTLVDPRDPASVDPSRLQWDASCLAALPAYPDYVGCNNTSRLLLRYISTPTLVVENAHDAVIHEPYTHSYPGLGFTGMNTLQIRRAITAGGAWFPAHMGVFIPNFRKPDHVLGMNNGTFLASDNSANPRPPPHMVGPGRQSDVSLAAAMTCFRARQNGTTGRVCRFINDTAR